MGNGDGGVPHNTTFSVGFFQTWYPASLQERADMLMIPQRYKASKRPATLVQTRVYLLSCFDFFLASLSSYVVLVIDIFGNQTSLFVYLYLTDGM